MERAVARAAFDLAPEDVERPPVSWTRRRRAAKPSPVSSAAPPAGPELSLVLLADALSSRAVSVPRRSRAEVLADWRLLAAMTAWVAFFAIGIAFSG